MDIVIGSVAGVIYVFTAVGLALRLFRSAQVKRPDKSLLMSLIAVAISLHAVALYQYIIKAHALDLQFFNALSLAAWLISLVWLLASIREPLENLGIAILPISALALALEIALVGHRGVLERASPGLDAHILLSLLAYSLLSLAALQAVLLAIQEKHLREKRPGGFIRALPPLQAMEALLFRMIGAGFVLLSLALASGALFVHDLFAQHLVHKTVLSIIAWLVFATLLWGRRRFGWRGRTAIRWTLGGFVSLMLAYFGSKWVLEIVLHRRGY